MLSDRELREILFAWLQHEFEDISEEHCCSGWAGEIEFSLWRAAKADPVVDFEYGHDTVPAERLQKILRVADHLGGWIRWDSGAEGRPAGPVFVSAREWDYIYTLYSKELEAIVTAPDYEASRTRLQRWWTSEMKLDRSDSDSI